MAFSLAYGLGIGLAYAVGALWIRHGIDPDLAKALALLTAGAVAAGFMVALANGWTGRFNRFSARMAAAIVLLTVLTAGIGTAFLYLEYIAYYAQWWPPAFTLHWAFTAATTFIGLSFYVASVVTPMFLPLGLPMLLVYAVFLAKRR